MSDNSLHELYLGLGTNLGDKQQNIKLALEYIEKRIGKVVACSAFYITEPVGFDSENNFLNAACQVQTSLQPREVLIETQCIEKEMGRKSKSINHQYSDRVIDIDLLLFGSAIIQEEDLTLPHPHLHERDFVLRPLNDIASNFVHPLLGYTIGELLNNLND